jgi:hypothetical protein
MCSPAINGKKPEKSLQIDLKSRKRKVFSVR